MAFAIHALSQAIDSLDSRFGLKRRNRKPAMFTRKKYLTTFIKLLTSGSVKKTNRLREK
jgi:hypothetical protein